MSKTIEELAKDYAQKVTPYDSDGFWYKSEFKDNKDNFRDVAEYLYSLPLASRLTDAEKYMIGKEYADTFPNDPDQSLAAIRSMHTLERIFGKDFFAKNFFNKENDGEAVSVNTLHVGCHLNYHGKRVMLYDMEARVKAPGYMFMIYYDNCYTSVPMEEVEPIPITPKLLGELGFDFIKRTSLWLKTKTLTSGAQSLISSCIELKYMSISEHYKLTFREKYRYANIITCRYLHEAEAFLALNGVELIKE